MTAAAANLAGGDRTTIGCLERESAHVVTSGTMWPVFNWRDGDVVVCASLTRKSVNSSPVRE